MITAGVVILIIIAYILLGMAICRPSLKPIYAAIEDDHKDSYKKITPDAIMRQTAVWFTFIVVLWPLTFVWVMCWIYARPRTPQYHAHVEAVIRDQLEIELAEARRTIEEFSSRSMPAETDLPQSHQKYMKYWKTR